MARTKRTATASGAAVQPTNWGLIILYGVIAAALTVLGLILVDMALPRGRGGGSTIYQNLGGGDAYAPEDANDGTYYDEPEPQAAKVKDRRLIDQAAHVQGIPAATHR